MPIPYEKSFASNIEKSKYFSNKNELKPEEVYKGSSKKFIFNCDKCSHEIIMTPASINRGRWCSYCTNQKLCDNECNSCYNKSFESCEKKIYWSDKNKLTPRQVFKCSNKKYIFECKCGHEFVI